LPGSTRARALEDEDALRGELRRISQLTRFVRGFYIAFFERTYAVRITGFAYRDKRRVARRLVEEEDELLEAESQAEEHGSDGGALEPLRAALDLAAFYEDLCDLLHVTSSSATPGTTTYVAFHEDAFPTWLWLLADWLEASGKEAVADDVEKRSRSYSRAV
jgi:hypothetical protein